MPDQFLSKLMTQPLRCDAVYNQYFPAARRRRHFLHHARIVIGIMQIA
jgi:hypothetical protein